MKENKNLLGIFGILSIIIGIIGIFLSTTMTIISMIFFGIAFVALGIAFFLEFFSMDTWKEKIFDILIALLYVVTGIGIIMYPDITAITLTLFIAGFLLFVGILRIIAGIKSRKKMKNWTFLVFSGILNIILSMMIYADWPESGKWVIGLFVSIEFIMQGILAIAIVSKPQD